MATGKLRVVSIFAGAGGLDYGLEAAGLETVVAIDLDADCCATLRINRRWPVLESELAGTTVKEVLDASGLAKGSVDIVAAGPPCQPFSKSAYWARGKASGFSDSRARSFRDLFRLVEALCPRLLLIENVPGFQSHGGVRYLKQWLSRINRRQGTAYTLTTAILNAADYGVPQIRRRFFAVADREGEFFRFPSPTHGEHFNQPWITAWDAIGDLEPASGEYLIPRGRWGDLLPSIPEGKNYLWHTDRGGGLPLFGWRTRYWSFLLKLAKNLPSWTIPAAPSQNAGPFHWNNRCLSTAELSRLQTFPEDIVFSGNQTSRRRQLGNAVPSLLAEVLGASIKRHLSPGSKIRPTPSLFIAHRDDCPRPEAPSRVRQCYHKFAGNHAAHPGSGNGPRAVQLSLREAAQDVS